MREMIAKLYNYDKVYLYMPTWRGNLNDDFIQRPRSRPLPPVYLVHEL